MSNSCNVMREDKILKVVIMTVKDSYEAHGVINFMMSNHCS